MSTTDPALSPAAPEPPPRRVFVRKKSGLRKWLKAALVLAACVIAFLGWQYVLFQREKAKVEVVVADYLSAVEAEDYPVAYELLAPETKARESISSYERVQRIFRQTVGPMQSRTNAGWNVYRGTNGGQAVFAYDTKFAKGSGVITLSFVDTNGRWEVSGHRIDSPLFVELLTCPSCKNVQKGFSPYCPACGKANPKLQVDRSPLPTQPSG